MVGAAERLPERSRWRLAWDALLGRQAATTPKEDADTSVAFAELVWAHNERQRELERGVNDGEWEQVYRGRLKRFKDEHGRIVDSYWCRYEASGVALTERERARTLRNLFRRDCILRLHTATDWRTSTAPMVASALHEWQTAAIKASEVLRDASEKIALQWILAGSTRLLAAVDRRSPTIRRNGTQVDKAALAKSTAEVNAALEKVVQEQRAALARVDDFYRRAGENSARIVYFRGMAMGTGALTAIVGTIFATSWAVGWIDPREPRVYTLFATLAMGAVGAILSVMTRMASKKDPFTLDFEVGRKSTRYLGALRPAIGALFALALYLALKSNLLEILQGQKHGIYFYSSIAFAAGFSERRAKVLLDGVLPAGSGDKDETDGDRKG